MLLLQSAITKLPTYSLKKFFGYRVPSPASRSRDVEHKSSVTLLRRDRRLDCLVHLGVAGAAAQIAAERVPDFIFCWFRIAVQQSFHSDHESRRAVTAL